MLTSEILDLSKVVGFLYDVNWHPCNPYPDGKFEHKTLFAGEVYTHFELRDEELLNYVYEAVAYETGINGKLQARIQRFVEGGAKFDKVLFPTTFRSRVAEFPTILISANNTK